MRRGACRPAGRDVCFCKRVRGPVSRGCAGGVVNITTKAGTNIFHRTVYDYLRNRLLSQGLQNTEPVVGGIEAPEMSRKHNLKAERGSRVCARGNPTSASGTLSGG